MSADQWRKVIDINLTGTFLIWKAIVPLMKGRGWGRIVSFTTATLPCDRHPIMEALLP